MAKNFFSIPEFPELVTMLEDKNITFEEFEKECDKKVNELMKKLIISEEKQSLMKNPKKLYKKLKMELSEIKSEVERLEINPKGDSYPPSKILKDASTQTSPE